MKGLTNLNIALLSGLLTLSACGNNDSKVGSGNVPPPTETKDAESLPDRIDFTYHILKMKDSGMKMLRRQYDVKQQALILALNRVDRDNVGRLDSIIIPDTLLQNFMLYSPFPYEVADLKDVKKIIFFSYPAQAFGAYENGRLVKWGPTSMGRKDAQTPTGLYYANWKAEETQSTVDDEWILKWNFNIENKEGVGWHQYAMPGYPASHSCLRLLESDARYLYDWADQWVLKGTDNILANGTPTVVFGSYPFGGTKPWLTLAQNPKALDITPEMMMAEIGAKKNEILTNQQKLEQQRSSADSATASK
jgi:hypothetical protein